ncbi:MAG: YihY/virulence factor BrkB family protein [Chitinophagaceae bacterium]
MLKAASKYNDFIRLFGKAFGELGKNDPLRMAGATAFFTTFALPPILVILIQVLGLIFDPNNIRQQLFRNLSGIIGTDSVQQIINTLSAFRVLAKNWYVTLGGFIFLLFIATTLFKVIKSSLNQLWKIKVVRKRNLWSVLRSRLQSVIVILIAGVLLVIGILAEAAQAFLGKYIVEISPVFATYFNNALNYLLSIIIVTLWFAIVFRFLPDGRPTWKIALTGGFITSLLFNIGKVVLRWLLTLSNINTIYGASGSIVLLLLFVFYSSLILYYGATFTKVLAIHSNMPIRALSHAMHYQLSEVRADAKEL